MRDTNPNSSPDRKWWGTPNNPTAPASGVEGPVTDLGNAGPGYYQTRGVGNKTGRISPRQQTRASARDLTFAKQGLIDQGAADPHQGQLFNADTEVGPRRTDRQIVSDKGLSMPVEISAGKESLEFGGARGFLPNLNNKQKMAALNSVQEGRVQSGTYRGGGATAEMMEDRHAAFGRAKPAPWYSGVNERGENDVRIQGEAAKAIGSRAVRSGVSSQSMTRAAALTSPQAAWDIGTPGSPDYRMPNLSHAEQVVQATKIAKPYVSRDEAKEIGSQISTTDGGLPTMGAKAAGVYYDEGDKVSKSIHVSDHKSQKAPNFEASLRMSSPEVAERRIGASSFTVDRHDAKAAGIGDSKVLEQRKGVYDVAAMTGTRGAFKNRVLPPDYQAQSWVGQRGPNQHEGEHQGMLRTGTPGGKVQFRTDIQPGGNGSRTMRRQPGDNSDLEF
jgi:hypothetical protein